MVTDGNLKKMELTAGVVPNRVIFHSAGSVKDATLRESQESLPAISGVQTSSESAGILLRLTRSLRDIKAIANVAFKAGSSQHGNARRASVGCKETCQSVFC